MSHNSQLSRPRNQSNDKSYRDDRSYRGDDKSYREENKSYREEKSAPRSPDPGSVRGNTPKSMRHQSVHSAATPRSARKMSLHDEEYLGEEEEGQRGDLVEIEEVGSLDDLAQE